MHKRAIMKTLVAALIVMLHCASLYSQTGRQIQVIGVGSIFDNDVAAARDRALDDALRKAVEQSIGTFIDAQTKVENYMVVEDRILSWSRGYVSNYAIMSEMKKTPEMYEVQVQATVDMTNLEKDANAVENLIMSMGNPRVMIMIDEQNIGESLERYSYFEVNMTASETAMMNSFLEKNFQVVDPSIVRQNKERDAVLAAINGDARQAATIAAKQDAEVVITGKAIAKVASGVNLAGMKSCQANLTARVIDADVGTVIATGSKHAAYPHIDEVTGGTMAIEKAATTLSGELITKILETWRSRCYDLNSINLFVTGMENYTQAADFKNALQFAARGVKNVFQRNIAGGIAEFDLKISGNAEQLARELDQRSIGNLKLAVTGVTANKVTVKAEAAQNVDAVPANDQE